MSLSIATAVKNATLDTYGANFNNGTLKVYAGTVPTDANTALSGQTLLGTLTFGATAFAAASAGSMSANAITQDSAADASGTATFYRALKSDGTTVIEQGAVGTSGAELNLNTTAIVTGGPILVSSFTRTL